jgi:hypothetical protein
VLLEADQDVLRLEIPVDESLDLECLNSCNQLLSDEQASLQRQLLTAIYEEILQRRAEQLNHHDVILSFLAKPHKLGEPSYTM